MSAAQEWILSMATLAVVDGGKEQTLVQIPAGARVKVEREISPTELEVSWNGQMGSIFREDLNKRARPVRAVPVIMRG